MNLTIIPVGTLGTNCHLIISEKGAAALIDPGAGGEKIANILEEKGCTLKCILLTHGHWDHNGGVRYLLEKYPETELCIGRGDKEMVTDEERFSGQLRGLNWEDHYLPEARELADGDKIELDEITLTVMETPGHSPGSICFVCGDMIFSGDTVFLENVGRCDLWGGDFDTMKATLAKLTALPGDYTMYPGHGPHTTLQHEREKNPYFPR
ncbi:MAG: MBL fold metallo-hydrolase [Oscillospiraceae bacterium]|nr:MBL fold metallo-hydrolase [Oscillospiraceae bacterium]